MDLWEIYKNFSAAVFTLQLIGMALIIIAASRSKATSEDIPTLENEYAIEANENLDIRETNASLKAQILALKKDLDLCHATIADLHDKNEQFAKENTDFLTRAIASELEVEKLQDKIYSLNSEILLRKEVA